MNKNKEIWVPIKGYDGLYEVSDQGRVKSIGYGNQRILKPKRNKGGYLRVNLYKNLAVKMCYVHRLVCQAFLQNPDNLPEVNHKDEDKTNNKVENLEWCDRKYNSIYGSRTQRQAEKTSKPVLQYLLDGKFLREWKSTRDIERNLGYFHSNISACCRGKLKSAHGFLWIYK